MRGRPKSSIAATPDVSAAIAGFAAGKSDIVIGDGLAGLGEARAVPPRDALRLDPLWGVYGYRANVRTGPLAEPGHPPRASLAVDRPALVGSFGLAAIEAAPGLVPPSLGLVGPAGRAAALPIASPGVTGRRRPMRGCCPAFPCGAPSRRPLPKPPAGLLAADGWTAENPLRLVLLVPRGPRPCPRRRSRCRRLGRRRACS